MAGESRIPARKTFGQLAIGIVPALSFFFAAACLLSALSGCGSGAAVPGAGTATVVDPGAAKSEKSKDTGKKPAGEDASPQVPKKPKQNLHPVVVIKTSQGEIRVKLDAEKAPVTVDNFLSNYVERGFYDQTVLHHVEKGMMIAGGGYLADQTAKEAREQILNEADNELKNLRGTIAMARHPEHAFSATSQFFFNLADNPDFDFRGSDKDEDYGYCVFGKVVAGLDVLDAIAETDVHEHNGFPRWPVKPVTIESIRRVE